VDKRQENKMQIVYECQICKKKVYGSPPEWCPACGGHRVIFKRLAYKDQKALLGSFNFAQAGSYKTA
jgi:rRNA maturation endonuclease Nob1